MNNIVALPVLLPLLGAGVSLALRGRPLAQRFVSISFLSAVVVIAAYLMWTTDQHGPQVLWVGAWPQPLGIVLVADRLSALMLLVSSTVTLIVVIFSIGQGVADRDEATPITIYYPTYLILAAGIANAFLAGDLFNLFVGFEVLLFASYVLLTLGGTGERIRAGTTYVVVSLLSSLLFLVSIAVIYAATGTINLAQLAQRIADLNPSVSLVLQLLLLTVFAIKAAVFPMSAWLPDSYPTAPAPVTAVFAGLLTKVGIYAIIRTQTLLFPHSPLSGLLMWAALLTMLVGILGAVSQSDIKRMLSFTLVSHIGYMVFGVALGTEEGYAGAIFYVVHHIAIQSALFLIAGLIDRVGGSTSVLKLGGLAAISPLLGLLFFAGIMNLGGIPPFSGFLGKVALMRAGIDFGTPLAVVRVVAGVVTSLLTLYALAKAWTQAFWRSPNRAVVRAVATAEDLDIYHLADHNDYELERRDVSEAESETEDRPRRRALPRSMVAAASVMVALSMALTVLAGPLYSYSARAAHDLLKQTPYAEAVLKGPPS
ncbi:MAG: Na+/H+ antiporter subunit D [Antricoccus sp.]